MKRINIFKVVVLYAAILGTLVSCSDDFLDLAPISNPNEGVFYKSQADFEIAIVSVYRAWRQIYADQNWTVYNEHRADVYDHFQYLHRQVSENDFEVNATEGFWNDLYNVIFRANMVLDNIDGVEPFDEGIKNRLKAEARFMRADAYFVLVRFFGAVPLPLKRITSKEAMQMGRTPVAEVFKAIEEDLLFAASNLPSTVPPSQYGRFTSYAAKGQLARVYITLSGKVYNTDRWADAKPLLEEILFSSPYRFSETYEEIFAKDGSNEKGEEMICSAVFREGPGGNHTNYHLFIGLYRRGTPPFEPGLVDSYEEGDIRKGVNIASGYTMLDGLVVNDDTNIKFEYNFDASTETHGADWPVLRYTDAYLLYAETLAEVAGSVPALSLDILNKVRNRAGLPSMTTTEVPDIAAFRMALERERHAELMFECARWFDLVRWGRAVDVLRTLPAKVNVNETWLLFPIPQSQIDIVGDKLLPQNPGF